MQITLVRHPPCAIAPGHCYGQLDLPLSPEGQAALPALSATLRALGTREVITSPATRCKTLADQLGPAQIDPRLQELNFGEWEGRPWDDIARTDLDAWAADPLAFAPPGGESGHAFLARITAAAGALREAGRNCIVITHGGPLRLLPALLRGEQPDLLAPAPPPGAILHVPFLHEQASADSPAHSATTAHAPSTSPVNPPI